MARLIYLNLAFQVNFSSLHNIFSLDFLSFQYTFLQSSRSTKILLNAGQFFPFATILIYICIYIYIYLHISHFKQFNHRTASGETIIQFVFGWHTCYLLVQHFETMRFLPNLIKVNLTTCH